MGERGAALAAVAAASAVCGQAWAQQEGFHAGALIPEFGPVATIEEATPIPEGARFRISFDVAKAAEPGSLNRSLVSGARFLNMHAEAGVGPEAMSLAFVVQGASVHDVTNDDHYEALTGESNANADLVAELLSHGARIEVCGQSAARRGVAPADLLPGVKMSLSAMTAHALLQQEGFTLNPF